MATTFTPWKIWMAYLNSPFPKTRSYMKIPIVLLNSPTPKTLLFTPKISHYFIQNWNLYNFGLFLPNFGYHGNPLCSLKNSDSIFEFYNPENLIINVKVVTISRTKLKSVHLCFCVCKFGCDGNFLCSLNFFSIFEFADPKNPSYSTCTISCTGLKSVQFWFIFSLILVIMATSLGSLENSRVREHPPAERTITKFGVSGRVANVII